MLHNLPCVTTIDHVLQPFLRVTTLDHVQQQLTTCFPHLDLFFNRGLRFFRERLLGRGRFRGRIWARRSSSAAAAFVAAAMMMFVFILGRWGMMATGGQRVTNFCTNSTIFSGGACAKSGYLEDEWWRSLDDDLPFDSEDDLRCLSEDEDLRSLNEA